MTDTRVTWRGLAIGGGDSPYYVQSITGWDESADVDDMSSARTRGHGDHVGDMFSTARIVTVSGVIADRAARDTLARALLAGTPVSSDVNDLTIDTFGQVLTSGARLIRRSLPVELKYGAGQVPFALQWRCPDPLRYGPSQSVSTGLPTSGGGLAYPLTYPLTYGALGASGQVTLTNPGTADAAMVLSVTGSLPSGFEVSAAGLRLRYPVEVPAGQTVVIDTAGGTVLVEGTADRRQNLTVADWLTVPAGGTLTLQFISLGGAYDPAALLSATYAASYW